MRTGMRRGVALLLSAVMVLGMVPGLALAAPEQAFTDTQDHWAREAIETWNGYGVMNGYDGQFMPGASITRAEMAQVITNLLRLRETAENAFSDVADDAWYAQAVLRCAQAGIMVGAEGRFRPGDPISRQESMVVLARTLGFRDAAAPDLSAFDDGGAVADWARGAVAALVEAKVVQGTAEGRLAPLADVSRAEVVTILNHAVTAYYAQPGTYTLDQTTGSGVVLVAAGGVSVGGTASGSVLIAAGAAGGTVELKDLTADRVLAAAGDVKVKVTGKSDIETLEVRQDAERVTVELGKGAVVGQLNTQPDTQIIKPKPTVSGGGASSQEPAKPENSFPVYDGSKVPDIYVAEDDYKQIVRAVGDLQADVVRVTTREPAVKNTTEGLSANAILVGSVDKSPVIKALMDAGKLDEAKDLTGKWESYVIKIVDAPMEGVDKALVIAGSDKRGTVYGIYDVSEQIGVSPWYYWGDIAPEVQDEIVLTTALKVEGEPSVKYRGIFINDEQNLVQWATDHGPDQGIDPKTGEYRNLGPEFYKSVYELLLRLRGNYLWPGMHSETRLGAGVHKGHDARYNDTDHFNLYPENRENADDYGIIVGTSHCEPMMRNGTAEWGEFLQENGYLTDVDFKKAIGEGKVDNWMYEYNSKNPDKPSIPRYDYSENTVLVGGETQKAFINRYWEESVKAYKDDAVSYTLGMRGIHDAGFRTANASTNQEKLAVLQEAVDSQVEMMEKNQVNDEAFSIFIPYKEVLPLYEMGLKVPDETTIVWSEDNHGFIRRFPTEAENQRSGGSGVYYHLSYEGVQSYQWMNSTPPALILSEMSKAYDSGIQQLWVLNVGDIKPSEIGAEFFLDLAWDVGKWDEENLMDAEDGFLTQLSAKWFPDADSGLVGEMLREYYHLNHSRKPEHTTLSESRGAVFDPVNYGDESMQRLADYQDLAERALAVMAELAQQDDYQADAFYEIVAYPILGAYYNNLKYYHVQKNTLCTQQGRTAAANLHANLVDWAQAQETAATEYYNKGAFEGKWELMMQPTNYLRTLQSKKPATPALQDVPYMSLLGVAAEGQKDLETDPAVLDFSAYLQDTHYIDVFNLGGKAFGYTVAADKTWVKVSEPAGTIYDEQRLFVDIDWDSLPAGDQTAVLTIAGAGDEQTVTIRVNNPALAREEIRGYAEAGGCVAIEAEHFTENHKDADVGFTVFDGLGRSGGSVSAGPMGSKRYADDLSSAPCLIYDVYFQTAGSFSTTVYRVPSLDAVGQRLALAIDDGAPVILAGQSKSENEKGSAYPEWTRNITNGIEKLTTTLTVPSTGYHTVKLYMVDPGVSVDRIVINTGGEQKSNQGPRESYHSVYNPDPAWTPKLLSMEEDFLDDCIGEVEAEIERLGTGEAAGFLQSELEAVRAALAGERADDTVRRCCARLRCAMAKVTAEGDVDALWAEALVRADALEAAAEATADYSIPPYDPEAVAALKATRDRLAEAYAAAGGDGEKLEVYTRLMSAILGLKRSITITAASQEKDHPADKVMDGKGTAGNSGDDRWAASGDQEGQWVLLDLHDAYDLTKISILWFGKTDRNYQYRIETSLDGVNFTTAVDRSGNTKSQLVEDAMAHTARYVRIAMVGKSGGSYSIWEIKLTGTKVTEAGAEELAALRADIATARAAFGELTADTYTVDSYAEYAGAISDAEDLLELELISAAAVAEASRRLASAPAGLTERSYVIQDTFDDVADLSALTGWDLVETGGTVSLVEENGNKYLKIEQTQEGKDAAGSVEARRSFPETSGKVYIEAKVRSDTPATFFGAPYLFQNNSSATTLQSLILQKGGDISTYNGKNMINVGKFQAGEWCTISLIVDSSPPKMQVYLNGELAASDLAMRNPLTALGMLRFYSDDKNADRPLAVAYVDDVSVYREGEGGIDRIKVACVGDSITYGSNGHGGRVDAAERYPAQLQKLLGSGYEVQNFGVSGACMLNAGTDNKNNEKGYVNQQEYINSQNYQPDIVVIMLGTNDSKALNWETGNTQYMDDALALIDSYEALDARPAVYLATSPTVLAGSNTYGIQGGVVHSEIVSLQKQIALAAGAGFIDVHKATQSATEAQFPDKVHGNVDGYALIARTMYGGLTAESKPTASPIVTVDAVACNTVAGVMPELPDYVDVAYADSTTGLAQVEWALDGLTFGDAGTVNVPGKLKGLADKEVTATVTVTPPPETTAEEVQQAVDAAKAYRAEDYTIDSYAELKTAIAAGERAVENNADAVALDQCLGELTAATEGLRERDVKYSEDFDGASQRDDLAGNGWTFVETAGTVTLETDGEDSANKYLKIAQTSKTVSVDAICSFEDLAGKIYIQADIRSDTPNTMFAAPLIYQNDKLEKILGGIQWRDNGKLMTYYLGGGSQKTKQIGSFEFEAGTWYTLSLIIDPSAGDGKGTMQVYLDGEKIGEEFYLMRNPVETIGTLRFYSDDKEPEEKRPLCMGYIDNISVYQEGSVLPQN